MTARALRYGDDARQSLQGRARRVGQRLRRIARMIAVAVVRHLRDSGFGRQYRDEEIEPAVDRAMWWPEYLPIVPG